MSTGFPFVKVPNELHHIFGTPDGGSHVYRREGSQEEVSAWFDAINSIAGPLVSPGGVSMYCPVTRAGVHKRVKEGRLTMFLFHVTQQHHIFFGKTLTHRESPFAFIPVSEAKAWKKELEQRAIARELVTKDELEGSKPDWLGDFMEWQSQWRKEQQRKTKGGRS